MTSLIRYRHGKYLVPDFSFTPTGKPILRAIFLFGNFSSIALRVPVVRPNDTFGAVVSFVKGSEVLRYKLWEAGTLYFPLYYGQTLGPNARLEIYEIPGKAPYCIGWAIPEGSLLYPVFCCEIPHSIQNMTHRSYYYCYAPFCFPVI